MDLMRELSMTHRYHKSKAWILQRKAALQVSTSARYLVGDELLRDWLEEDRAELYGSHDQSGGMLTSVMQSRVREEKVNFCTEPADWCQVTKVKRLITLFLQLYSTCEGSLGIQLW